MPGIPCWSLPLSYCIFSENSITWFCHSVSWLEGAIPSGKIRLSWWISFRLPFGNFILSGYKKSRNWWLKSFLRAKHHLGEKHFKRKHISPSIKQPALRPADKVISGFPRGGPARTRCRFSLLPAGLCQSCLTCPADAGALSRLFLPTGSQLTWQTPNLDKQH